MTEEDCSDLEQCVEQFGAVSLVQPRAQSDVSLSSTVSAMSAGDASEIEDFASYVSKLEQEFTKEVKSIMIVCANSDICGLEDNELLALKELDLNRANEIFLNKPIYQFSSDSNITNGFSNMAGSGKRRIFLKIYEY